MRRAASAGARVIGVARAVVRSDGFLYPVQAAGVLVAYEGLADLWSRPGANVALGVTIAVAAEMWMGGGDDERAG